MGATGQIRGRAGGATSVSGPSSLTSLSGRAVRRLGRFGAAINDSGWFRLRRALAWRLHIFTLAALGGAAGAGCLVTDPVPYEPSENIPPIVLSGPEITPNPFDLRRVHTTGPALETAVHFSVPVVDFNMDDTLSVRLFVDEFQTGSQLRDLPSVPPPATGGRERSIEFDLPVDSDRLSDPEYPCHKVLLAISDSGWGGGPPFYNAPTDNGTATGKPVTTVATVQWWIWVDNDVLVDGPPVGTCGRM